MAGPKRKVKSQKQPSGGNRGVGKEGGPPSAGPLLTEKEQLTKKEQQELNQFTAMLSQSSETSFDEARKTIRSCVQSETHGGADNLRILLCALKSTQTLAGYATLDYPHVVAIKAAIASIKLYIRDESLERPRNFLIYSSPGAGKSHLVTCIGKILGESRTGLVSFNMATMQSADDLASVLDAARNLVVDRKTPLIFLDEFDSDDKNYPLLLPLLWDGSLNSRNRELRLGRSVFFLAGSRATLANQARLVQSKYAANAPSDSKLEDLFSRINGATLIMPSLSQSNDTAPDKVVLAMHLLRRRFRDCMNVPWGLLAFIAKAKFKYDARSIATLIDLIPIDDDARILPELKVEHLEDLQLSTADEVKKHPLWAHFDDEDGPTHLADLWKEALKRPSPQLIRHSEIPRLDPSVLAGVDWSRFLASAATTSPTAPLP